MVDKLLHAEVIEVGDSDDDKNGGSGAQASGGARAGNQGIEKYMTKGTLVAAGGAGQHKQLRIVPKKQMKKATGDAGDDFVLTELMDWVSQGSLSPEEICIPKVELLADVLGLGESCFLVKPNASMFLSKLNYALAMGRAFKNRATFLQHLNWEPHADVSTHSYTQLSLDDVKEADSKFGRGSTFPFQWVSKWFAVATKGQKDTHKQYISQNRNLLEDLWDRLVARVMDGAMHINDAVDSMHLFLSQPAQVCVPVKEHGQGLNKKTVYTHLPLVFGTVVRKNKQLIEQLIKYNRYDEKEIQRCDAEFFLLGMAHVPHKVQIDKDETQTPTQPAETRLCERVYTYPELTSVLPPPTDADTHTNTQSAHGVPHWAANLVDAHFIEHYMHHAAPNSHDSVFLCLPLSISHNVLLGKNDKGDTVMSSNTYKSDRTGYCGHTVFAFEHQHCVMLQQTFGDKPFRMTAGSFTQCRAFSEMMHTITVQDDSGQPIDWRVSSSVSIVGRKFSKTVPVSRVFLWTLDHFLENQLFLHKHGVGFGPLFTHPTQSRQQHALVAPTPADMPTTLSLFAASPPPPPFRQERGEGQEGGAMVVDTDSIPNRKRKISDAETVAFADTFSQEQGAQSGHSAGQVVGEVGGKPAGQVAHKAPRPTDRAPHASGAGAGTEHTPRGGVMTRSRRQSLAAGAVAGTFTDTQVHQTLGIGLPASQTLFQPSLAVTVERPEEEEESQD